MLKNSLYADRYPGSLIFSYRTRLKAIADSIVDRKLFQTAEDRNSPFLIANIIWAYKTRMTGVGWRFG